MPHRLSNFLLFCLICLCYLLVPSGAPAPAPGRAHAQATALPSPNDGQILVLYSGSLYLPAHRKHNKAFITALEQVGFPANRLSIEFLDLMQNNTPEQRRLVLDLLRAKYGGKKIGVIVSVGGPARDVALRDLKISPSAPLLTNSAADELGEATWPRKVVQAPHSLDWENTLRYGMLLFPDTKHVFTVLGNGKYERKLQREARRKLAAWAGKVDIRYSNDMDYEQILQRAASLPPHSIILFGALFKDKSGRSFLPRDVARLLAGRANAPVFGMCEEMAPFVLGGSMTSPRAEGARAARLGLEIMAGRFKSPKPVVTLPALSKPIFNWRELKHWGVEDRPLPKGSVVINYPRGIWDNHRDYVIGGVILLALQAVMILALLRSRRRSKKAESVRHAVQERFQRIVDTANEGVWEVDKERISTFVNLKMAKMLGYQREEIIGRPLSEFIHPDDMDDFKQSMKNRASGLSEQYERRYLCKGGEAIWVRVSAVPILDKAGAFNGSFAMLSDITERRRSEDILRQREASLRREKEFSEALIQGLPGVFYLYDDQLRLRRWNRNYQVFSNISDEDKGKLRVGDGLIPADAERARRTVRNLLQQPEGATGQMEGVFSRKDGSEVPMLLHAVRVDSEQGPMIMGVGLDISGLKQAEEAVRQSEATLRGMAQASPAGMALLTYPERKVTWCNQRLAEMVGYGLEKLIGLEIRRIYASQEEYERVEHLIEEGLRGRDPISIESKLLRKDGSLAEVLYQTAPLDPENLKAGLVVTALDITDRKRAEEGKRLFEENFAKVFRAGPVWMSISTVEEGIILEVNESFSAITGYAREEVIGVSSDELKIWADREQERALAVDTLRRTGHVRNSKVRMRFKDGSVHTMLCSAEPISYQGRDCWLSVQVDISEMEHAREALAEEKALSDAIIQSLPGTFFLYDHNWRLLRWNKTLEESRGVPAEQLPGKKPSDFLQGEDMDKALRIRHEIESEGEATLEASALNRDGSKTPYLYTTKLVKRGGRKFYVGVGTDISELKWAQVALKENEEKYRTLFESANDAIFLMDADRFADCNSKTLEMFRCSREQIIGKHPYLLSPETQGDGTDSKTKALEKINAAMEGEPQFFQWRHMRCDGDVFDADVSLTRLHLLDKYYLMAIVRDVTMRRIAEEERKRLEAKLVQAQKMEAIGTLAGGIAHDFNNILSAILGFTDLSLLQLSGESYRVKNNLQEILKASLRARDLVSQILAFSRRSEVSKAAVELAPIIKETLKFLRASMPSTIKLDTYIDPEPITVLADATQLHQVLMNLCTNAHHAMREHGGTLSVSLAKTELTPTDAARLHSAPGPHAVLMVADTGRGIPIEVQQRIFEPFFTTKKRGEGTGMGLSVVHGIVNEAGGSISVYSEEGKGSTFKVFWPLLQAKAQADASGENRLAGGEESILIVDDEEAIVSATAGILESLGYSVTTFLDSPSALAHLAANPDNVNLLITDLTMPDIPGLELAQRAKEIKPGLPVILATGFSSGVSEETLRGLGVDRLLRKPVPGKALAEAVRATLDRRGDK